MIINGYKHLAPLSKIILHTQFSSAQVTIKYVWHTSPFNKYLATLIKQPGLMNVHTFLHKSIESVSIKNKSLRAHYI